MIPAEAILRLFRVAGNPDGFRNMIDAYVSAGYFYSGCDAMIAAKHCPRDCVEEASRDPWMFWPREESDCWYVYAAAGEFKRFFEVAPFRLEFVSFERHYSGGAFLSTSDGLRTYPYREVERLVQPCTTTASLIDPPTSSRDSDR